MIKAINARGRPQSSQAAGDAWEDQIAFFALAAGDGRAVQRRIAQATVAVLGSGRIAAQSTEALQGAGVGALRVIDDATEATTAADLASVIGGLQAVVVGLDAPSPTLLEAVNQAALQTHVPWIVGLVDGGICRAGPTIIPHQSPCYRCYDVRRAANLPAAGQVAPPGPGASPQPAARSSLVAPRPFAAWLGAFLALETLHLISRLAFPQTVGRVALLDFYGTEITYHRILRLPNCPACGFGRRTAGTRPGA